MSVDFQKYKEAEKQGETLNYEVMQTPPEGGDNVYPRDDNLCVFGS